ncbi:MAG: hypothetical protein WC312_07890 [Candidatus Omnitrophota bacterium]|jgi:hypothetical protein
MRHNLKAIVFLLVVVSLMAAQACPSRPTITLSICQESGLIAGDYCPVIVNRTYYKTPQGNEPIAPSLKCNIHIAVQVKVCAETGLLPNPYCPVTENRPFAPGTEPTEICAVHKKPLISVLTCFNSGLLPSEWCNHVIAREFSPGTEPKRICNIHRPYFIGTSYYEIISAPLADGKWFIQQVAIAGGNATEFFIIFNWAGVEWIPFEIINPYYHESDDTRIFPLWDLTKSKESIWIKYRALFAECKAQGITPFIRILDFCSIKGTGIYNGASIPRKLLYPFMSSKQRLVDGTITGGNWGIPVRQYYSAVSSRIIAELKAAGVKDYFIAPWNEADVTLEGWTEEEGDAVLIDQFKWFIEDLTAKGVPRNRIIINTTRAYTAMRDKWKDLLFEIHGINSDTTLSARIKDTAAPFTPNGDGYDKYAAGRPGDPPTWKEPSVSQGRAMGAILKAKKISYMYFNRNTEALWPGFNIGRAKFDVLEAIAGIR